MNKKLYECVCNGCEKKFECDFRFATICDECVKRMKGGPVYYVAIPVKTQEARK